MTYIEIPEWVYSSPNFNPKAYAWAAYVLEMKDSMDGFDRREVDKLKESVEELKDSMTEIRDAIRSLSDGEHTSKQPTKNQPLVIQLGDVEGDPDQISSMIFRMLTTAVKNYEGKESGVIPADDEDYEEGPEAETVYDDSHFAPTPSPAPVQSSDGQNMFATYDEPVPDNLPLRGKLLQPEPGQALFDDQGQVSARYGLPYSYVLIWNRDDTSPLGFQLRLVDARGRAVSLGDVV